MEIAIANNKSKNYLFRTVKSFANYFVLLIIGFFFIVIVNGFSTLQLNIFFIIISVAFIYCLFINRNVLLRITFFNESKIVKIEKLYFNKIQTHEFELKDVEIILRQDLLARYAPWVLSILVKKEKIYNQKENSDWKYADFLKIQEMISQAKK